MNDPYSVTIINATAARLWSEFSASDRSAVRFGMIPAGAHREAQELLGDVPDFTRLFALALMECAKKDGGMRV